MTDEAVADETTVDQSVADVVASTGEVKTEQPEESTADEPVQSETGDVCEQPAEIAVQETEVPTNNSAFVACSRHFVTCVRART